MLNILGNVHRIPHRYDKAKLAYEACLQVVRETGEKRREVIILENLALVAFAEGEWETTLYYARACVQRAQEIGFVLFLFMPLHPLAGALSATGQSLIAARLVGIVDAFLDAQRISFPPNDQHIHDQIDAQVRGGLEAEAFQAAWEEGYHMTLEEAPEYVLSLQ